MQSNANQSSELLNHLDYPRKHVFLAYLCWLMGAYGAHWYYLGQHKRGMRYSLTGGGGFQGKDWLSDFNKLPGEVKRFNAEQSRREAESLPPIGFEEFRLAPFPDQLPPWVSRHKVRRTVDYTLGILSTLFGALLASMAVTPATKEPGAAPDVLLVFGIALVACSFPKVFGKVPGFANLNGKMQTSIILLRSHYFYNRPSNPFFQYFGTMAFFIRYPLSKKFRQEIHIFLGFGKVVALSWAAVTLVEFLVYFSSPEERLSMGDFLVENLFVGPFMTVFLMGFVLVPVQIIVKQQLYGFRRLAQVSSILLLLSLIHSISGVV